MGEFGVDVECFGVIVGDDYCFGCGVGELYECVVECFV